MLKWVLALVIALVVLTVLSPWLSRYGLGRLPGDLTGRYKGRLYYLPFASTIVLSLALTLLARLLSGGSAASLAARRFSSAASFLRIALPPNICGLEGG